VSARREQVLALRRAKRLRDRAADDLTREWFPQQAAAFNDQARLRAFICGRRAGKTRGGCRYYVRQARKTREGRFLYLNSTWSEAERLAWHGNRDDGMAALVKRHKIPAKLDVSDLSITFLESGATVYLRGADKERELEKALGGAYHEVWWDEAQKIPPKLEARISEVMMPALLDFGGRFTLTGTPVRQMSGLFYNVTRPEMHRRRPGWSVHHWTLLDNPFFGRAVASPRHTGFDVLDKMGKVIATFPEWEPAQAAALEERRRSGLLELQTLFGGPDVAPFDSPIMMREGGGLWVKEDSNFVYAVNKMPTKGPDSILYAPHRVRPQDGFPDLLASLIDLPGDWRDYMFALGADLGYSPDPFAIVLWAWHPNRPQLYEVISFEATGLRYEKQAEILHNIRSVVSVGVPVADAGGGGKPAVAGWSEDWIARYGIPLLEADKAHKHTFIELMNADILRGWVKYRDGSPLWRTATELQWATIVTGAGRLVEDPTMANHCTDAGLYAHRHSFNFRYRPEEPPPPPVGSPEWAQREEAALEGFRDAEDELD
jgi:hypothetical protein